MTDRFRMKNLIVFVSLFLTFLVFFFGCENENEAKYKVELYPDSTIKYQGFFIKEQRHGYFTFYNKNGMLTSEGAYSFGKRNGTWKYYDVKGMTKTAQFKNGKLINIKCFSHGRIYHVMNMNNNEIYYYYKDDQIVDSLWHPISPSIFEIKDEEL